MIEIEPVQSERLSDPDRLRAIIDLDILDSEPEDAFDRLTRLASHIIGAPVALVSIVDDERQFFKSLVGLEGPAAEARETPLSHSFCQYVVSSEQPLRVQDARQVEQLKENGAIDDLGVIAYLGIPIVSLEGQTIGSFCVIDGEPREWTDEEQSLLEDVAESVMQLIHLQRMGKMLRDSYLELRETEMQRDEFVHMLTHDIKNVLAALSGFNELLASEVEMNEQLDRVRTGAQRSVSDAIDMIDSMMGIRKAEAGRLELHLQEVNLHDLVSEVADQHRASMQRYEIDFQTSVDLARVSAQLDRTAIKRVLSNLLTNALHHTPAGGHIELKCSSEPGASEFDLAVVDTGLGVPEHARDKIFSAYEQVSTNRVRGSSTGLGLPYSKLVVEMHGGRLELKSSYGEGATFTVRLPFEPAEE